MKILTVRQPWAHALIHLGKDVENRSWPTDYRGPLVIHASKTPDRDGGFRALGLQRRQLEFGVIVGIVDLVDCRRDPMPTSSWADPDGWHWHVANPRAVDPILCTGQRGLFDPPELLAKRLQRWLTP